MAAAQATARIPAPPSEYDWDQARDALFYRRLPLALDSVLRARTLAAVTSSILHGGEYLWPGAELRVDGLDAAVVSEAMLVAETPAHILVHGENTDLRQRTTVRRTSGGVEVVVVLVAHGVAFGELVLAASGPDGWITRQEREHLRAYAEMCSPVLHSCLALAELRRVALTDPLTGVANRRALDLELDRIDAEGRGVGLLFVDADGLRSVNNTLGYDAGNTLICALASTLAAVIGGDDIVARLGGDEFVVILDEPGRADELAEKIEAAFAAYPLPADVAECAQGASVGSVTRRRASPPATSCAAAPSACGRRSGSARPSSSADLVRNGRSWWDGRVVSGLPRSPSDPGSVVLDANRAGGLDSERLDRGAVRPQVRATEAVRVPYRSQAGAVRAVRDPEEVADVHPPCRARPSRDSAS